MTRTILPLLLVSLAACETTNPAEETAAHDTTKQSAFQLPLHANADVSEPDMTVEYSMDLICSTGSFFDLDFQQQVIRMNLTQQDDGIVIEASKGIVHPSEDSPASNANFQMQGTIGDDILSINLDDEHQTSGELGSFGRNIGIELIRVEHGEQWFYHGSFIHAECGSYGDEIDGVFFSSNSVTCWQPDITPEFSYDARQGICLNDQNEAGFNPWTVEMIRETQDGQCTQLGFVELNEQDYEQPELSWDLRGSDLSGTYMYSAKLHNAQLEGAQMEEMYFGDAHISGSIDDFTLFPEGCDNQLDQLTCNR